MRISTRQSGIALVFICFAVTIGAGPVLGTGGSWVAVPSCAGQPTCASNPVWVNPSQDDGYNPPVPGAPRNLGSILNNTSPFPLPTFSGVQWYAAQDGVSLLSNLFFSGSGTFDVSLLVRSTSNAIVVGWYGFDDQGNVLEGGVLTNNAMPVGGIARFTNTTPNWGLFMKYGSALGCAAKAWNQACDVLAATPKDVYAGQIALSSSITNPTPGAPTGWVAYETTYDPNRQHFLAFQSNLGTVIGIEDSFTHLSYVTTADTPYGGNIYEGLGDFNDNVLLINSVNTTVENSAVPEPSTSALIVLGAGLGVWLRFRKRP